MSMSRRALLRVCRGLVGIYTGSVLAGCGPRPVAPGPTTVTRLPATPIPRAAPAAPTAAGLISLEFWTEWSGSTRVAWVSLMDQFHQTHPKIAIQSKFFPLIQLQEQIELAVASSQPPDLWLNAAMIRPAYIVDGAVSSLTALGKVPTDFYPAADPASVRYGQRWGVPNNGGLPVIWYNVDRFRSAGLDPSRPPRTWEDLINYGKALSSPDLNQWGLIVPNRHYPWTTECWYGFLLQAGGDIFAPDGSIAFNSEAGVEALAFWASLFRTYRMAPTQVFDADTLLSRYETGTIGMFPMYSVETAQIASFPFASLNTPYPTHVTRGTHFAGNYTTIAAASPNPAAAFTWCEWWWQPEINATWCASTGGLPSRVSSSQHPIYQEYLRRQPLARPFIASLPFAKAIPSILGIEEVEQRLSEAIYDAAFGFKSPRQALQDAVPAVHTALARYTDRQRRVS